MHERHEGMETIGKAIKALHRELDAASPDLDVDPRPTAKMARPARKVSGWFPAGTGPDVGKTGAKPEIWQEQDDFAAKLDATFQAAAQALQRSRRERRRERDQGALRGPRQGLQGLSRQVSRRR